MAFMASPDWEPEVAKAIESLSEGTFVDVGAAIGVHAVRAARVLGHRGRVIALEPSPLRFSYLERNIRANRVSNVTALNVAAGAANEDGVIFANLVCGSWDRDIFRLNAITKHQSWPTFATDARTLDTLLKDEPVRLIKLDVEGSEFECLSGATRVLSGSRPIVIFEALSDHEAIRCSNLLKALSYEISGHVPGNLVATPAWCLTR
jgi:FkbM family methyltransferase